MSPRRLARRCLTIPGFTLVWALATVLAPVALLGLAAADLVGRRRFALTRAYLMGLVYLTAEVAAIVASAILWPVSLGGPGERSLALHYRFQAWWSQAQFRAAVRLFGIRVSVEGLEAAGPGPIILLTRHVSVVDNLIPAVFVAGAKGLRVRWVMNRSLLRDPALDLFGNRLPNCFVRGRSDDSASEIERVRQLAAGLGPGDGVAIFPEGTLYSPAKRAQVIRRLEQGGDAVLLAQALRLQHTLPPRLGGTLALLEAARGADAVFCAHTGLEGALDKASIAAGGLIGRELRIHFRRVPAADIPEGREALTPWLFDQWAELDRWVGTNEEVPRSQP